MFLLFAYSLKICYNIKDFGHEEGVIMSEEKRSSFTGKIGFVLAAAGSAVGLGNIWRFPYLAAKYGGGIFVLTYIILAVTLGITLMIAEIAIGRKTKLSSIGAYQLLDKRFSFVGWLGAIIPAIITPYYCVIGGWVCKYLFAFVSGDAAATASAVTAGGATVSYFENFIANPIQPIGWFLLFLGLTALVVLLGVDKGIEKVSTVMMPLLIAMILGISIYVLTRDGAAEGAVYYLKPDFSNFSIKTVLAAMGQMFYSLSLAMGILITYGSYMKREISIETSSLQIVGFDSLIAFLAGLCIIPAVFACGQGANINAGPSLMFITLPSVFAEMPGGSIVGAVFFLLVFFAALTSSISLMETVVATVQDKCRLDRKKACLVVLIICLILGIPSSLGNGVWSGIKILGMTFLDFFDFASNTVLMPTCAIATCIFVGWVLKPKTLVEEVELSGKFRLKKMFAVVIKYIAPICIAAILISSILSTFGVITI